MVGYIFYKLIQCFRQKMAKQILFYPITHIYYIIIVEDNKNRQISR